MLQAFPRVSNTAPAIVAQATLLRRIRVPTRLPLQVTADRSRLGSLLRLRPAAGGYGLYHGLSFQPRLLAVRNSSMENRSWILRGLLRGMLHTVASKSFEAGIGGRCTPYSLEEVYQMESGPIPRRKFWPGRNREASKKRSKTSDALRQRRFTGFVSHRGQK